MKRISKYFLLAISLAVLGSGMIMMKRHVLLSTGVPYILAGLGCCLFGESTGQLFRAWASKKDPQTARKEEIEAKDERNIQIQSLAKSKGFDMMNFTILPLTLAFGFMNESFRVILPLAVLYLFIDSYVLYWRNKLEKQM